MFKETCPGSREIKAPYPEDIKCFWCDNVNEIWSDETDIVCDFVIDDLYIFWTAQRGENNWIGHAVCDINTLIWTDIPENRIASSETLENITGIDFIAKDIA